VRSYVWPDGAAQIELEIKGFVSAQVVRAELIAPRAAQTG
jgi:hypothetical protein